MIPSELLRAFNSPIATVGVDGGFVRLVDAMGDDAAIAQAARVSYGEGTRQVNEDRGLIRYLVSHRHTSPLEMCEIKLHWKLPIFVARQIIRHRTTNVNEMSGRFSVLPDDMYVPAAGSVAKQSSTNKQGRDLVEPTDTTYADRFIELTEKAQRFCRDIYDTLVGEGYARELARINLPVAQYTEWYWKIDLHNLLHFLRLRLDQHAQYETRVYAQVIAEIVKAWVPLVWEAFEDYQLNAVTFSAPEQSALQYIMALADSEDDRTGEVVPSRLNKREVDELINKARMVGLYIDTWKPALLRGVAA
jgi:thymidylate synthase (FAD)